MARKKVKKCKIKKLKQKISYLCTGWGTKKKKMSKISSIKERFFDVLRFIVVGNPWSYDFEADGIYYSRKGSELTVTAGRNRYCGRVVVPATVARKNKTYNVTAIGESAFENCKELTDVVIPDSAHSIGKYAFYGCSALVSVVIGKKVMSFGERAFTRCPNLRSVTIRSQNVAATSYNWLNNIPTTFGPNVKEYIIGEGVTVIGKEAFYGCFNIKSVTIPSSMKKIGKGAFSGCSDFTDVTCHAETPPVIEGDAFVRVSEARVTLRVPASALETYRTSAPWSKFGTIQPI